MVIDQALLLRVVALAALAGLLWLVRGVAVPMIFVAVVTFIGAPVVARIEGRGIPRAVGSAVFLAVLGLGLVLLAALVAPRLIADVAVLLEELPRLLTVAAAQVQKLTGFSVPTRLTDLSGEASRDLLGQLSPYAAKSGALVGLGALGFFSGVASVAGVMGQAALVPVISYFVLAELPEVMRFVRTFSSTKMIEVGDRYLPLVDAALSGLIKGQLTVVALMSVIYSLGLGIAGVPLAAAIGVLAGFAYLIPFASATVALVLSVAFTLLEHGLHEGQGPIIGAVITCAVLQILEGYVLTPRIVGQKAGLSPLAALLAVLLGGSAAGFLGMLFALPMGAVVALVLREELRRTLEKRA